jgi:hypothetical protein
VSRGQTARAAVHTSAPIRRTTARHHSARPELRVLSSSPVPVLRARRTAAAAEPRSRRAPFVLLVVALLVGTTLGLLVLNTAIAVDSLKATQLRTQNTQRAQEAQQLEERVIAADAPARLAAAAVAAHLVPAGPAAYLVIGADGRSALRGTPTPAPDPATAPDESGG